MKLSKRLFAVALACTVSISSLTACGGMTEQEFKAYAEKYGYITKEEAQAMVNSGSNVTYITNSGSANAEQLITYQSSRLASVSKQLSGSQWQIEYTGYGIGAEVYMTQALGSGYNGLKTVIAKSGEKRYIKTTTATGDSLAVIEDGGNVYVVELIREKDGKNIKKADGIAIKTDENDIGFEYLRSALNYVDAMPSLIAPSSENILSIKSGKITYNGKEYYAETAKVLANVEGISAQQEVTYAFDGATLKYVISGSVCAITNYTSNVDSGLLQVPSNQMTIDEYDKAYSNTGTK